ncbi:DUF2087 domain-containing protein [Chengkuizengella axinellae]|uniref:DUF2087 domain-containing protein n=1 Tax=Chengkuizengella axinellae TaxID=3064388 RepID=A0ABT9J515_9BACL|nr:DUF2087 domain-containing protein [Chengkuizengella sp. 2205SS18-9]MDP5276716.1 DUF2087 domain-containing protein [Chengkuizengella sp. 2205SS18-9]
MNIDEEVKFKTHVLNNFIDSNGKVKNIPSKKKKKLVVLEYLVEKLHSRKEYSELEINEYIKQFHEDFATIRREFIINGFMDRNSGIYVVNPDEEWTKWQAL